MLFFWGCWILSRLWATLLTDYEQSDTCGPQDPVDLLLRSLDAGGWFEGSYAVRD